MSLVHRGSRNQPRRRIVVVGTSGAGKTFVARRLAEILGVPYICNDAIIWRENWKPTPRARQFEEFDLATRAGGWTYDGNIGNATKAEDSMILGRADTLVWLDLPKLEVMRQLLGRTIQRVWQREELWHGNTESWRMAFASRQSILWWAWRYYAPQKANYRNIFCDARWNHVTRIRLTSRAAVNRWLAGHGSESRTVPADI